MKKVYLDYAATTPVRPEVLTAMAPYWTEKFGNASSLHLWGREAREAVEEAREKVARILNCVPEEIIFTGTTTTSDNLAILGTVRAYQRMFPTKKPHLITTAIEHHGILDIFRHLEKEGLKTTYLPVDKSGLVDLAELKKALKTETLLVSVMYANNEVGTVQPVEEIAELINKKAVFHTDAAAVAEYLDLNVKKLRVDLMTLGSHKFGGPKGVGILFVKKGVKIDPITFGGHHELGLWPGTEAVPLIVGMAEALKIADNEKTTANNKVTKLRDELIKGVMEKIPNTVLTGHPTKRLADIASFCFEGAEGEAILLRLDALGIAASSGSACTSGELKPSHVLLAMGIRPETAHGSIRFSLGRGTTKEEINYVLTVLPKVIADLRAANPLYN